MLQFPNGAANLTYLLRFGETELVLRRPPFGTIAPGAHDMRREYRVLSRLWRHFAPRAARLAFCDDHGVCGADFFVMERRAGVVVRGVMPRRAARTTRTSAAASASRSSTRWPSCTGSIPPRASSPTSASPTGFAARQVAGWRKRWELARPPEAGALMDELRRAPRAARPGARRARRSSTTT